MNMFNPIRAMICAEDRSHAALLAVYVQDLRAWIDTLDEGVVRPHGLLSEIDEYLATLKEVGILDELGIEGENTLMPYLVDVVDTNPQIGLWETWDIDAFDADEARSIAEVRLKKMIDAGSAIGSFELTNIRQKV